MTAPKCGALRGELAVSPVMPLVSPEAAAAAWALYEELKAKLLVDDDYQAIAGKRYIKRSGFRKLAVYFGLSDSLLEQERVDRDDKSFTWRIVTMVTAPNGRTSVGVGVCDSTERKFAHLEHDVYATAHTRAKSRAISDMVAGGAVSAEEVEATQDIAPRATDGTPVSSRDRDGVIEALEREGIDTSRLTIQLVGGRLVVAPVKYLGDVWGGYNDALVVLGFKWVSAGKESRWEAP